MWQVRAYKDLKGLISSQMNLKPKASLHQRFQPMTAVGGPLNSTPPSPHNHKPHGVMQEIQMSSQQLRNTIRKYALTEALLHGHQFWPQLLDVLHNTDTGWVYIAPTGDYHCLGKGARRQWKAGAIQVIHSGNTLVILWIWSASWVCCHVKHNDKCKKGQAENLKSIIWLPVVCLIPPS